MTTDVIKANKEEYLNRCRKYIHREGIDKLLDYLENKTDFFTAPSSTSFHLNEDGGLCRHSLNVHDVAMKLVEHVYAPSMQLETAPFRKKSLRRVWQSQRFFMICVRRRSIVRQSVGARMQRGVGRAILVMRFRTSFLSATVRSRVSFWDGSCA